MNPTSKKFISLFLIFSLVLLSANLYAKERRGAKLIITGKDGWQTEGELITVKPNSLLLLSITGRDVSVDIADIKVIRVVKKSKALLGSGIGLIIFGGGTALFVETFGRNSWEPPDLHRFAVGFGVIGAIVGLVIGGITGKLLGTDKKIQIEGMTDTEIQETLEYLRKKARIRDYK
ncbi:hypothetical protein ES703_10791 [subsurface metagenome]